MEIESFILDQLLNRYERSQHYKEKSKLNRKIRFYFTPETFPDYFDETSPGKKALVNQVTQKLENEGVICIEWVRYEKGNLIVSVTLNLEQIEVAYKRSNRFPKREKLNELETFLNFEFTKFHTEWVRVFIQNCLEEIAVTHELPTGLPKDKPEQDMLFNALHGLEEINGEELPERVFSRRFLGHSKAFVVIKSRFVKIIRKYLPGIDTSGVGATLDEEAILQEVGIAKSIEELLFFGPLKINLFGTEIDFTPFIYGTSVNGEMIKSLKICDLPIKRVITFENKTNYLEFIKQGSENLKVTLGVYLAGFHSPIKRLFLLKILAFLRNNMVPVEYYHWGDIDLGGFKIFVHLKTQVFADLKPFRMDVNTLRSYQKFADTFDERYRDLLKKLLTQSEYEVFYEVIHEMLNTGMRLEQEALLIESD